MNNNFNVRYIKSLFIRMSTIQPPFMNAYALFDTCEDILKVLNISEKQMSGVISVLLYELSQSRMLCKDDVIKHNINKKK